MSVNFMDFEDVTRLRQIVNEHVPIGTATLDDVLSFCTQHKMYCSGLIKNVGQGSEHMCKYPLVIFASTPAPRGLKNVFKLSWWLGMLKSANSFWQLPLIILWVPPRLVLAIFFKRVYWRVDFFFEERVLLEIEAFEMIDSLLG